MTLATTQQSVPLHYPSSQAAQDLGAEADAPKIYGDTPFYLVSPSRPLAQHPSFQQLIPAQQILNTAIANKPGEWARPVSEHTVFPTRHVVDYVQVATRRTT